MPRSKDEFKRDVQVHWESKRKGKTPGIWEGPHPKIEFFDELMDAITCLAVMNHNRLVDPGCFQVAMDYLMLALQAVDNDQPRSLHAPHFVFDEYER